MFEKALRLRLRYDTVRGAVDTEDLFAIPLRSRDGFNLDEIAKTLNREVKDSAEESFVAKSTTTNERAALALDIVKHVITVKLAEEEAAANAATKRAQKQHLLSLIADKQNDELKGKTVEELSAMVEAL